MAISLTPPVITHLAHTSKGKMRPGPQINAIERRSYDAAALTAAASAALVQSKPLVRDDTPHSLTNIFVIPLCTVGAARSFRRHTESQSGRAVGNASFLGPLVKIDPASLASK